MIKELILEIDEKKYGMKVLISLRYCMVKFKCL